MSKMTNAFDTLMNLVTGLGTAKDKTSARSLIFAPTNREQLLAAYRSDWIVRKVVTIPAEDATREWRQWSGTPEQVSAIEEAEEEFQVRQIVLNGLLLSRLYGGAGIVLGVGEDHAIPLPEQIPQGSLRFLNAIEAFQFSAGAIQQDITQPGFGLPMSYRIGGAAHSVAVDASRVVRLVPRLIPDLQQVNAPSWGDSVIETILDAAKQTAAVYQGSSIAVEELNVDIIRTPDFMRSLANKEYRDRIIQRFQLGAQAKSLTNTLILDKDDEWERLTQTFAGIPDMMRLYLLQASAIADIPATRFLGQSPQGLSATGESDLRNYYDSVGSDQRNYLQPAIRKLDEVLVHSTFGSWPDGLEYEWRSLWQATAKERAEISKLRAETARLDVNSGLFNDDLLRAARSAALAQDDLYPGWEGLVEEYGLEPDEEGPLPEPGPQPLPLPIDPSDPGAGTGGSEGPPANAGE